MAADHLLDVLSRLEITTAPPLIPLASRKCYPEPVAQDLEFEWWIQVDPNTDPSIMSAVFSRALLPRFALESLPCKSRFASKYKSPRRIVGLAGGI